jgi:hypothetical protein
MVGIGLNREPNSMFCFLWSDKRSEIFEILSDRLKQWVKAQVE